MTESSDGRENEQKRPNSVGRVLALVGGFFFLGLGIAGIVLPVVPTTGPLLLAAALFARSSQRFHDWLLNHRIFGTYIRNYREHHGMTAAHKRTTLITLWVGIGISAWITRGHLAVLIILAVVLAGVTIHVATLRTAQAQA